MLNVIETLPDGILELDASSLHTLLPGPTLLHLNGIKMPPIFVSVLMHGNEHTGWEAIRKLLSEYETEPLPRALSVFIGNIQAARFNQRFLAGQPDYNRIWNGGDTTEHKMMQQIVEEMQRRHVHLSVDVHNNTGENPYYACINKTYNPYVQLATLFSSTVVYFLKPVGVQSMAFSEFCPAVTIECGKSGDAKATERAYQYLKKCLLIDELSDHAIDHDCVDLFHTVAVVKVLPDIHFGFEEQDVDLVLNKTIEKFNFNLLPAGYELGKVKEGINHVLDVRDEQGNEVSHQNFYINDNKLCVKQDMIPAMITTDKDIIQKDCLCYLMEHYPLSHS